MIDTGKSAYKSVKSQADIIILKYLLDAGIKNIKSLIITHFDNDHCGGAIDVMTKVKVGELYVNDSKHNSVSAKMIYETANKHNITFPNPNRLLITGMSTPPFLHQQKEPKVHTFPAVLNPV